MLESVVDLTYRGLSLGRRVRLSQVRPRSGYLEIAAPMPVGTPIVITTDEGLAFDATVTSIHEQVAGVERAPGMTVAPALAAAAAHAWWSARVALPDDDAARPRTTTASGVGRPPGRSASDSAGEARVVAGGGSQQDPDDAPEEQTTVMAAVEPVTEPPAIRRTGEHEVVDDGSRTMIMASIDPDTLGEDGETGEDGEAGEASDADARDPGATIPDGSPVPPAPRGRKKRKSRR